MSVASCARYFQKTQEQSQLNKPDTSLSVAPGEMTNVLPRLMTQ